MDHLPASPILQFLILHGYWFAVPIMIVEGPVATIVMGFFASFGYFNPFVVFLFGFCADLISDTIFYSIGYFKGEYFIRRFGRFFKLSDQTFQTVKKFYDRHGGKSVFLAKILTGVVPPVFIVAGFSKMPRKKFYTFAAMGGVIWTAGLVALGYFFGAQFEGSFSNMSRAFGLTGSALAGLLIFFAVYRLYLHKFIERRLKLIASNFRPDDSHGQPNV